MTIILSAPSKTFLLGEYAALVGCPAIILNTNPRFELHIEPGSFNIDGIEPASPAGRFITDNVAAFKNFQLAFKDPHNKQGGLGASSAQFLLIYSLFYLIQQNTFENANFTDYFSLLYTNKCDLFAKNLLSTYLKYAWSGIGLAPSGADIIGQLTGRITWFDKSKPFIQSLNWPFANLNWVLVRTGVKIPTHDHLQQLDKIPSGIFSHIITEAYNSLLTANAITFLQTINEYQKALAELNLTASYTLRLLDFFESIPYVLAAKGCGALGADIILCIVEQSRLRDFYYLLENNNLGYLPSFISAGIQYRI